jgi:hypothetical protein
VEDFRSEIKPANGDEAVLLGIRAKKGGTLLHLGFGSATPFYQATG